MASSTEKESPYFVEAYRGIILVKTSRKWRKEYLARLPLSGIQEITVFEEILENYFADIHVESGTSSPSKSVTNHSKSIIHPPSERGLHNAISQKRTTTFRKCL
jgi:hypothetical protein